jgi:hypothetical protein
MKKSNKCDLVSLGSTKKLKLTTKKTKQPMC